MMIAVDIHFSAAGEARDQTAILYPNDVLRRRFTLAGLMWNRLLNKCGYILDERTAPVHIQTLDAEANTNKRQILLLHAVQNREIRHVSFRVEFAEFRMSRCAIVPGVDIRRASRQKNTVHA